MILKRTLLAAAAMLPVAGPFATRAAHAQAAVSAPAAPAPAPMRVRGKIEKVDGTSVVIRSRDGGDVTVHLAADAKVVAARKTTMAEVKPGSFIGTAAMRQPDGTRRALEVTVFPPAMAGSGEGSYEWDLSPGSTMTNATVADLVSTNGHTMTLRYKGGPEQTVTVPDDAPVVLLVPDASHDLLKPGASVFVVPAKAADGTLTAARITVGEDGVVPPM